jgi:hypothetical protein
VLHTGTTNSPDDLRRKGIGYGEMPADGTLPSEVTETSVRHRFVGSFWGALSKAPFFN